MIPYENLSKLNAPFREELSEKFRAVLEKGWFIMGYELAEFEREFAEYCGVGHCIGVANGLEALIIALKTLALPEGGEVIVASNTYIASILAIIHAGLRPVLVEPEIATYNLDANRVEEAITDRTVAIMPVHLYGKCCDMAGICAVAATYGLHIVEDCAQAHGATFYGRHAGSFGDINAFSFYPTKNLGALGDGGGLTTQSESLTVAALELRNYGSGIKYENRVVGYNSRLDEMQAAFLRVKLEALDAIIAHKRKLADLYHENLSNGYIKPVREEGYGDVFHIYNVRHHLRDSLRAYLRDHDIATEIHYPIPPYRQRALAGYFENQEFPIADAIHATTLSLPISYCHTEEDVGRVIEVLNAF